MTADRIELSAGDDRVIVAPQDGGRIASVATADRELLRTQGPGEQRYKRAIDWGCFLMVPWVGRLDHGRLPVEGTEHTLPPSGGEAPHAIHGVGWDKPWRVADATDTAVTMELDLTDPWPLGGSVRHAVELGPGSLHLSAEIRAAQRRMPAALGWHPWFLVPDEERTQVELAATATLDMRTDLVRTGDTEPLDATTTLNHDQPIGERRLDHTYVGTGTSATVWLPELRLDLRWEGPVSAVTVHTPEGALCVEPLTAWPNAAALAAEGVQATGLKMLDPGAALRASFHIAWTV